jgi:hypothetical protein
MAKSSLEVNVFEGKAMDHIHPTEKRAPAREAEVL